MNRSSYQQPGQTGQSAMGQPARGPQILGLDTQMNALENVYTAQLGLSSRAPQHAAQHMTQPDLRLPGSTLQFSSQRPYFGGQVSVLNFFVVDSPLLTPRAYSQAHYGNPQILQPFSNPPLSGIQPMHPHGTGPAIVDWDLGQPARHSISISSGTRASTRTIDNPESSRPCPARSLGHPRPIIPLPSRASLQNFEPITHGPVHSLDPLPAP